MTGTHTRTRAPCLLAGTAISILASCTLAIDISPSRDGVNATTNRVKQFTEARALITSIDLGPSQGWSFRYTGDRIIDQACLSRLRQQRLQALQMAETCGFQAERLGPPGPEAEIQVSCGPQPAVTDQLSAQQACGRVFACAANALAVAIAEVARGTECTAVQHAGLARWPVPGQASAPPVAERPPPAAPSRDRTWRPETPGSGISGRF